MSKDDASAALFRAMRELVLTGDSQSLAAAMDEAGVDRVALVRAGRAAAARALDAVEQERKTSEAVELREGLSVLLRLLRRRDELSLEEVAQRARVDADELQRIEDDPVYAPRPRTIVQIEQFFHLPKRSLVKLAGMSRERSPQFAERVERFAASSKAMPKLTRDERRLLNEFVRFLGREAEADE